MNNTINIPAWLLLILVIIVIVLLSGGGYSVYEYNTLKKNHKDSLEVRDLRVFRLEEQLYDSNNYQSVETEEVSKWKNKFYYERKLRKIAEDSLFVFKYNNREFIYKFLTNYKSRRNRQSN